MGSGAGKLEVNEMTNKELFDRANKDKDLELQRKLRTDFEEWCKANNRTPFNPQTIIAWQSADVNWK